MDRQDKLRETERQLAAMAQEIEKLKEAIDKLRRELEQRISQRETKCS
jgi:uncharacterized protein Yka (UPF0111/DUF47 family)